MAGNRLGGLEGGGPPPPPSLYKVPTYSTRAGAAPRMPGGARYGGGNRAVNSQPRTGQSTSYGDVKSSYGGGRRVGRGAWGRAPPPPGVVKQDKSQVTRPEHVQTHRGSECASARAQ